MGFTEERGLLEVSRELENVSQFYKRKGLAETHCEHVVSDENLKTGGYGGGQKQRSASTVDAYLAIERIAGRHTHHPVAIAVMVLLSQGTLAVKHVPTQQRSLLRFN